MAQEISRAALQNPAVRAQLMKALLANAETVARVMDQGVQIPGTKLRVPLDPVIGLIPGAGDLLTFAISASVVGQAMQHNAPKRLIARMTANILLDLAIGAVPIVGDIGDFFFRANKRNLRLLEKHKASLQEKAMSKPGL